MSRQNTYSGEVRQVLANARAEAQRLHYRLVNTEHLLLGLLKLNDPLIESVFVSLHTSGTRVSQAAEFVAGRGKKAILSETALNPAARAIMAYAAEEAVDAQAGLVGVDHLLLGILREEGGIAAGVLASFGISLLLVRRTLIELTGETVESIGNAAQYQISYDATPMLNLVSRDLTMAALAGELDPMLGREAELERTMQILSRRSKNNPVLIGPAGVGKTAIAEGLALRIVAGQVPENLCYCRVVSLEIGLLTVGTRFRGDFEERLRTIMQEIISMPGIIVVIDEIHALVSAGVSEGSLDAANLFKPMLARGEFRCIGATTADEYHKTIETDPALERRFQRVQVVETSASQTLEILYGLRERYADFHHVTITDRALAAAVQLSSRYIANRFQPDNALDVLDETASRVCVQDAAAPDTILQLRDEIVVVRREKDHAIAQHDFCQAAHLLKHERQLCLSFAQAETEWGMIHHQQRPIVDEQDIAEVIAAQTGIPVAQIAAVEAERLLNLEQELHQRIVGQHEAVQVVAQAIRRSRTNIRDSHRPIGSFLFAGPTGVGKTELVHALAASLFGDENALLKLDMSEFMESHHLSRLIGSPAGYVGYDQAGQLTEAVRRRPYSIVLFDEIEKAHPKVFDLLLQILEDGHLTDARGQTVDFRNTVIVLTSNVGTVGLRSEIMTFMPRKQGEQERASSSSEYMHAQVMHAVKELFRPELLNRIDHVVLFHHLSQAHLHEIAALMLVQTQQRLSAQSITSHITEAARALVVEIGYDPEYGARPLRRTIQRLLEDMLAEAILCGSLVAGDSIIVDATDGKLVMHVSPVVIESRALSLAGTQASNAA